MYDASVNDRSRTNNAVEGWHNGIRASISKNPNFFDFIKFLKIEAKYSITRVDQFNSNGASKRTKLSLLNFRLKQIVTKFDTYEDKMTYLREIAKHADQL